MHTQQPNGLDRHTRNETKASEINEALREEFRSFDKESARTARWLAISGFALFLARALNLGRIVKWVILFVTFASLALTAAIIGLTRLYLQSAPQFHEFVGTLAGG